MTAAIGIDFEPSMLMPRSAAFMQRFDRRADLIESSRPAYSGSYDYLLLIFVFLITRLVVLLSFHRRGLPFPFLDSDNYILLANYIQETGQLPKDEYFGRHFPGVSIMMALINTFLNNMTASGFLVSWSGGFLTVCLFHYLFNDLRLSVLNTIFLPAWVANSSPVLAEGMSLGLCLIGILATRLNRDVIARYVLLAIAGYAFVCRFTAAFFLFPWLFGIFINDKKRSIQGLILDVACVSFPILAYAVWAYATIDHVFPQLMLQEAFFHEWNAIHAPNYYPSSMLTWPGHAMILGLFDSQHVRPIVRLINVSHFGLMLVCLLGLWFGLKKTRRSAVPHDEWVPLALVFVSNLLFALTIGGVFGFTLFYRYLASHMNPVIVLSLFTNVRVSWLGVTLLGVLSVAMAASSARYAP